MFEQKYMDLALKEANKALKLGEIPVGAVIVKNGKVIGKGYNKKEKKHCSLEHAELIAIKKANRCIKNWRLDDTDIYVTLEPCPMCASAIHQSRIKNVYYGVENSNKNNLNIINNIVLDRYLNPTVKLINLNDKNCKNIIKEFFKEMRSK